MCARQNLVAISISPDSLGASVNLRDRIPWVVSHDLIAHAQPDNLDRSANSLRREAFQDLNFLVGFDRVGAQAGRA
jgi:hypothetical protein